MTFWSRTLIIFFLLTLSMLTQVFAQDIPAIPFDQSVIEQLSRINNLPQVGTKPADCPKKIKNVKLKLPSELDLTKPNVFDSYFLFDARPEGKDIVLTGTSFQEIAAKGGLDNQRLNQIYGVFNATFGNEPPEWTGMADVIKPARTYDQAIALMEEVRPKLDVNQRLGLLSLILDRTGANYDYNRLKSGDYRDVPFNDMFLSVMNGTGQAGICTNIHKFGAEFAKALGFVDAGTTNGVWVTSKKGKEGGGHAIFHFKDPQTGDYYVQNYGQIINTHQKSYQDMLEYSNRILGGQITIQRVEHVRPDGKIRMHDFHPHTARWVNSLIEAAGQYKPENSAIRMKVSNREQTFIGEVTRGSEKANIKGFVVHSDYASDAGPVSLTAFGVSGGTAMNTSKKKGVFDEMGVAARGMFGIDHLTTPTISPYVTNKSVENTNYFAGAQITAHARINRVTGKLEIKALESDFTSLSPVLSGGIRDAEHDISAGVQVQARENLQVEASRHWEPNIKNFGDQNVNIVQTAYDKISVVVDNRSAKKKVYIVNKTDIYLMEGMEHMSAIGIRDKLKAVLPPSRLGEFTIVADASKVVANKYNDPFYRSPLSAETSVQWQKPISNLISIGASGTIGTKGTPIQVFEERATPDLKIPRGTSAQVQMRIGWGK